MSRITTTPSEDGFKVFDTPFGKVGIVICFDRHLPESIRTCTLKGAQLIIIPTANTLAEPLEMFEWELRVQAFQNNVFVAMCRYRQAVHQVGWTPHESPDALRLVQGVLSKA